MPPSPSFPPPISAMKLRLTSPALTVPLEEPITSAHSGSNNIPITNQDIIGHFNNQPPGTISNPSIIATYDNAVFASGSNPVTVVSESNYVPFPITPTFSFADITDRLTTSSSFSIASLITKTGTGVVSYVSSNLSVATVHSSSGQIVIKGPGFTDITATLAASADNVYTAAPSPLTKRLTVYRDTAALTNFPNITKNYNDPNFAPGTPSSLSDGLFTYTIRVESGDDTDVAEIVNNQVKVNNAGRVTLRATQAQTNTWNENFIECKLTVNPAPTSITVNTISLTRTSGDANFSLVTEAGISKTANSTGVLAYESDNTSVATIHASSGLVSIVAAGDVIFTVSLPASADGNWAAASSKTVSLHVEPAGPPISRASNNVTIQYTGAASAVPTSSALFIQANPHGTGDEWFAVVKDGMKLAITYYAQGTSNTPFVRIPGDNSTLIPFNNIVTTLMTDMSSMFEHVSTFNYDISEWDVSNVTNMSNMFYYATAFDQPLNSWDVSNVTNMSNMFISATSFNQALNSWNVSAVENMNSMFSNTPFNQPLNSWDVSAVTNMNSMFYNATAFDRPLNLWNVSAVTDMSYMFSNATAFNQPLNSWDVSAVTNMSNMFLYATAFDQPLNLWNVSAVTDMNSMFYNATVFNQDISEWNVSNVLSKPPNIYFSEGSALTAENSPIWFP